MVALSTCGCVMNSTYVCESAPYCTLVPVLLRGRYFRVVSPVCMHASMVVCSYGRSRSWRRGADLPGIGESGGSKDTAIVY